MRNTLHKVVLSTLLAGLAAVLVTPAAEANRGVPTTTTTTEPSYVPPFGQNAFPDQVIAPTVVPVDLPADHDPGAGASGDRDLAGGPVSDPDVMGGSDSRSEVPSGDLGVLGGILSRTGAETLPLARVGVATLALGVGLVVLARRRRATAPAA